MNEMHLAVVFDRRNGDQYVCFGYSDMGNGVQAHLRTAYGETRDQAYEECKALINKARKAEGLAACGLIHRHGRVTRSVGSNFLF